MRLRVLALVEGTRLRREIGDHKEREKEGKEREHDRVKSVKASHDDGEVKRMRATLPPAYTHPPTQRISPARQPSGWNILFRRQPYIAPVQLANWRFLSEPSVGTMSYLYDILCQ